MREMASGIGRRGTMPLPPSELGKPKHGLAKAISREPRAVEDLADQSEQTGAEIAYVVSVS
jgi:hypothetical protein